MYISCSYDVLVLSILMHLLFKYTSNILLRKVSISEVTIISFLQMLIIDHLVQKLYYLLSKMNVKEVGPFNDAYHVVTYKNIKSVPLYNIYFLSKRSTNKLDIPSNRELVSLPSSPPVNRYISNPKALLKSEIAKYLTRLWGFLEPLVQSTLPLLQVQ